MAFPTPPSLFPVFPSLPFPCLQPVFVCYVLCFVRSSLLSCFPSLNLMYSQRPLERVMETRLTEETDVGRPLNRFFDVYVPGVVSEGCRA
ncbi:hypothetical protein BDM02DRAFT_1117151 [Thelephora ganbajun]|uniref:Uncharacterized protein n=1 Tax=Thelephora ganbajun TaxID=370292 RepID=A0ACB6ZWQ6_THEGA|nr:hypothetical protein BDM02DRAFT_1117151 [Thelephora ganbajun]